MSTSKFNNNKQAQQRPWLLVGVWFGTIALIGVLKRILDQQGKTE